MEENSDLGARTMKCELNVLSKADGSAMLSQGNTVVLAALYGPLEVKHQKVQNDAIPVFVTYRSKSGRQGIYDKTIECIIQSSCEALIFAKPFCRHEISIVIQELQDSGSMLAAAINAACLAVINSGLEMSCLVAAVTCAVDGGNNFIIDPDKNVTEKAKIVITLGFENVKYNIVAAHVVGECSLEVYEKAVLICKSAVQHIFDYYKSIVKKYASTL
ncbi:unnamed protein product [Nezara viridula]|uniref:Exoribonuclease phosphorolytic domain-containing protein n=1 Tax=Nezara viridula TaxID=85310 RepID=A0A9P0HFN7_NEZVI|nr:unnamed protein product [Nezara viridula]